MSSSRPNRRRLCLTCLILSLLALVAPVRLPALSSNWIARVWQTDDGLLDNRVTGLAQSPDGTLWVTTRGGLLRFNGVAFEEFHLATLEGVVGNGARAMFGDTQGDLWLGAYREAVVRIGSTSATVLTATQGLPAKPLVGLAEARDGTRWLALGGSVGRIHEGRFLEITLPAEVKPNGRAALTTDDRGEVWCALDGQLGILRDGAFVPRFPLESREVSLAPARAGGVWICAGNSVLRLSPEGRPTLAASLPTGAQPLCALEDHEGGLWIGTLSHGLFRCDARGVEQVEVSHLQVGSLLEDREGNIWVGTMGGGLNRLRPRAMALLGNEPGMPPMGVISICRDAQGKFWAISATGQLLSGDGSNWTTRTEAPGIPGEGAACVAADRRGRLWVGTRGQGLIEVDLATGARRTWSTADGLPGDALRSLFVAADDSLWAATNTPAGLVQLAGGKVRSLSIPASVRNIRSIVQDLAGTLWVGTSDGQVLKVAGDALVTDPALAGAITTSVRSLHVTSDGSLWIAYASQAIARLKEGRYTLLSGANSLVPDIVSQLTTDSHGALWLAGSRGLYRMTLRDAIAQAEGKTGPFRPAFYGRAEGLPNLQPHYDNFPVVAHGADGRVFFSTSLGVLAVNPDNLPANAVPPPVLIEAVSVDDRLVALHHTRFPLRLPEARPLSDIHPAHAELQLAPDHRRVAIQFAALSYSSPEAVRYRYRLEGFEEAWSVPGPERQAQYSRLPAGRYRFLVSACNDAGVWNETPAALTLVVHPFLWQRWWFQAGILAAFTALVAALVRFLSVRRLQEKLRRTEQQAALFQERTRIARDIHDDLGGSLAHIKLLSEIATGEQNTPETAVRNLRQITATTQQVLKSLDETIWAISPGNDTLPHLISYVGQYAVEFLRSAGIACHTDLPDSPPDRPITSDVRHHVYLAVKEALTNIVRHAGARQVRLQMLLEGSTLRIRLEDDGSGLTPGPAEPNADGIRNMRQRMLAIGGDFTIDSRPGAGTRLEFTLQLT